MQILYGLIIVIVGSLMVIKTEFFLGMTGSIAWAENNLGTEGGTRLFLKLLGILIILLGFTVMVGLWNELLSSTIGRLFGR